MTLHGVARRRLVGVQRAKYAIAMTQVIIDGVTYLPLQTVANRLGVSRQTLWRWRKDDLVPAGHRHRSGQVLFTASEFVQIQEHANRLEPLDPPVDRRQIPLFSDLDEGMAK